MKKYAELSVGVYRMLNLNLPTYDCLDYETHATDKTMHSLKKWSYYILKHDSSDMHIK